VECATASARSATERSAWRELRGAVVGATTGADAGSVCGTGAGAAVGYERGASHVGRTGGMGAEAGAVCGIAGALREKGGMV
jgi:hypothetical protein